MKQDKVLVLWERDGRRGHTWYTYFPSDRALREMCFDSATLVAWEDLDLPYWKKRIDEWENPPPKPKRDGMKKPA
ncbi:MAG: hypothetical protein G01um101429_505 [Parcubacteria group bacterium Gr01-1014_29]|nr:MAG: hypothetical protein G01um101429_505 [Parcubacteria group bacterium Gr01-1014_29]